MYMYVIKFKIFLLQVFLVFYEKNVKFKYKVVFIYFGDQNDFVYMRMNFVGQVLVLIDGKKVIIEFDVVIRYVDENVYIGKKCILMQ